MFKKIKNLFNPYPVDVVIWKKYQNGWIVKKDQGAYIEKKNKTEDSKIPEKVFKLKNADKKIPPPDSSYYMDIEDKRQLILINPHRDVYYPVKQENGELLWKAPVLLTDENGNLRTDENGNYLTKKMKMPMIHTKVLMDDGEVIEMDSLVSDKMYDKDHWYAAMHDKLQRKYRTKNWWDQYGNLISTAILVLFMMISMFLFYKLMTESINDLVSGQKQIANAMKQLGGDLFNSVQATQGGGAEAPPS